MRTRTRGGLKWSSEVARNHWDRAILRKIKRASWRRPDTPNLRKITVKCDLTVLSAILSRFPTSLLLSPLTIQRTISRSRGVKWVRRSGFLRAKLSLRPVFKKDERSLKFGGCSRVFFRLVPDRTAPSSFPVFPTVMRTVMKKCNDNI